MRHALWFSLAWSCLALSCSNDECTVGESRCFEGGPRTCERDCGDISCSTRWTGSVCKSGQVCVAPDGVLPLCVNSATMDPRCVGTSSQYCSGDAIASCTAGYLTGTTPCGTGQTEPTATHCIDLPPGGAACIAPDVTLDPLCQGATGEVCQNGDLVRCTGGYLVAKMACGACTVPDAAACPTCALPGANCTGYLGAGCAYDGDCASGFVCHAGVDTLRVCTVPCSVGVSGSAASACFSAFSANGPVSGYYLTRPAYRALACIAGYCSWQ
jgi:hypothetical protein